MRLRPHHIYCYHFNTMEDASRGEVFVGTQQRIYRLMSFDNTDADQFIEVAEGADDLCTVCTYFDGTGCSHPQGGAEGVRKWDLRIVGELGITYGQRITVGELNTLIKSKAPLSFCLHRCSHYREKRCNAGVV